MIGIVVDELNGGRERRLVPRPTPGLAAMHTAIDHLGVVAGEARYLP